MTGKRQPPPDLSKSPGDSTCKGPTTRRSLAGSVEQTEASTTQGAGKLEMTREAVRKRKGQVEAGTVPAEHDEKLPEGPRR